MGWHYFDIVADRVDNCREHPRLQLFAWPYLCTIRILVHLWNKRPLLVVSQLGAIRCELEEDEFDSFEPRYLLHWRSDMWYRTVRKWEVNS